MQSPNGCCFLIIPTKVAGMFKTVMSMLQKDKFMVKTPGTCRRISVLWMKHSSTNKLDNNEMIATTTMNKAKMISAKSMSHSRKSSVALPAPVVADKNLESTMVPRRSPPRQVLAFIPVKSSCVRAPPAAAVLSKFLERYPACWTQQPPSLCELTDCFPLPSDRCTCDAPQSETRRGCRVFQQLRQFKLHAGEAVNRQSDLRGAEEDRGGETHVWLHE